MPLSVWLGAAAIACSVPLLWWSLQGSSSQGQSAAAKKNLQAGPQASFREVVLDRPTSERLLDPVLQGLAGVGLRFLPSTWFDRINERLAKAGLLGRFEPEQVIGFKMLITLILGVWLGVGAVQEPTPTKVGLALAGLGIAWFLPDLLLTSQGDKRVAQINRELPDVLDQLTISVEAGLGFESAMARIGAKSDSNLGYEFGRTLQDIHLGVGRMDALDALGRRTHSDDVRHFVLALRQAELMGVPLAQTLRIQSAQMRVKRRLLAEEAAYKLPVKMIFPLGFCIMPALFIVILGPAFIQISRIFS